MTSPRTLSRSPRRRDFGRTDFGISRTPSVRSDLWITVCASLPGLSPGWKVSTLNQTLRVPVTSPHDGWVNLGVPERRIGRFAGVHL
jgi:hypothetical protein